MDKKALFSIVTANALLQGPYGDIEMPRTKIKNVRNVPQYAYKKEQGRNEKCNCGSGLKYKKCCGK